MSISTCFTNEDIFTFIGQESHDISTLLNLDNPYRCIHGNFLISQRLNLNPSTCHAEEIPETLNSHDEN